ncbi:sodium:solute symporter [Rhizobium sp. Root708]|uniref:sodium:solute symporter family protein n=1 Tax=Rhizobium sp. Root708 TaxID=1736592 RepID=UPI0006F7DFCE|nr:sodium:solute symporter [Rhizobium sp. Root708]KRB51343.1 sodium:solute symporter [Rhizobium sp. Root708]
MNIALLFVFGITAGIMLVGYLGRAQRPISLEQWALGGRRFGALLVFVLMAGEIYTTFTFLGASGFAYGKGGAAFYILTYTCLAFISSYWLLPPIWRFASQRRLVTQPDFFEQKYQSSGLGLLVTIVGLVALIPYLILQLKGLGIIAETVSDGKIPHAVAIIVGAAVMALYVIASGMRGSAWAATVKDGTTWVICAFLGIYLPYHYYGGIGEMFAQIEIAKPGFLSLPDAGETIVWYCSTIALSALGLYMWPHTFSSVYTSKTDAAFRRNAVFMPLYALVMLFAMLVGFAAVLQVPGLQGGEIDLALLKLSIKTFDPWFVGVIGAAGVLTALVPGSTILIVGSTLISTNIVKRLAPAMSDKGATTSARLSVVLISTVAVYFTLVGGESIVAILIMGYSIVTQLFPALFASLLPRNPFTKEGAAAGIIVGVGTVGVVVTTGLTISSFFPGAPVMIKQVNTGFIALTLNVLVALLVSVATAQRPVSSTNYR